MTDASGQGAAFRGAPLAAAALISVVALIAFWELAEDFAYSPAVIAFDGGVSAAVQSLRSPTLTWIARALTTTGDTVVVVAVTAALFTVLWRRRHDFAVLAAVAVAGGALLTALLKSRLGRIRPSAVDALITLPSSLSFPSGHAMASLCVAVVGGYLAVRSGMRPAAKIALIASLALWALLVGLTRIYLGVHWPSDVLASWLLGLAWLSLVIGVAETRRRSR